jgi:agmatine deiminase
MPTAVFVLVTFFALLGPLAAEQPEESLPIGLTEEEKGRLDEIGMFHRATAPPVGSLRNPSEWEPSEGVLVRWPLGIPVSLVAEMSEDVVVTTIVSGPSAESSARSTYTSGGVNMANVGFIHASTNSIWVRDYGPWFIFEDDQLAIVDHIYNRPRPLDDVIPGIVGAEWSLNVYGMDLLHTGGNHMSNGLGTSSSTELVYIENPGKSEPEIDQVMMDYLGNDYLVLDYIQSGGIHHIDCWAKFLGPTTVMVKDVPPSDPTYDDLNARADFLASQISPWGVPYTVVRVYCPAGTYYTNSLILNDKVLVPLFGSSQDSTALDTYRNAMPGYEVLGFTGSWASEDALHCRAMGVPDRGTLQIDHMPFRTEDIGNGGYEISATIKALSGVALVPAALRVRYRADDGLWDEAPLTPTGEADVYQGTIPAQAEGSIVSYYVEAGDESGRVERHPYIGQPGPHQFATLCPDNPLVDVTPDGPLPVCVGGGQLLVTELTGGSGPFSYQWLEDGLEISGATSPTHVASGSGTHLYNCRVWGDGCINGRTDATDAQLHWQTEPVFAGISVVTNPQNEICGLDLAWDPATPACAGPVSYNVYRSILPFFNPGPQNLLVTGVAGASYHDQAELSSGMAYYYAVRAVDDSNGVEELNTVKLSNAPTGPGGGVCATSSGSVVTVPDGSEGGTTPLLASMDGADVSIVWDVTTAACASSGYHLLWGWGSDLATYAVSGADCTLNDTGNHLWTTAPDTSTGWAWFIVVGNDGATTEGGWGTDSASNQRSALASGTCGTVAVDIATCLP